jgi:hypothetical protein
VVALMARRYSAAARSGEKEKGGGGNGAEGLGATGATGVPPGRRRRRMVAMRRPASAHGRDGAGEA